MNINDAISRLPIMLRGRFSASNSATWLAWACDAMAQIERVCAGPGQILRCQAWQMASGFVPKPSPIWSITGAWLDGERVDGLRETERRGFQLSETADCERHEVTVSATEYGCEVNFASVPTTGTIPATRLVTVHSYNGETKTGQFTLESGSNFPKNADDLDGWVLFLNGEELHITSIWVTVNSGVIYINFTTSESGTTIASPASGQRLIGAEVDALADCEVHAGHDLVTILASAWYPPQSTPAGWTSTLLFDCDRKEPGRSFDAKTGWLVRSNLVVEGYRALARPASLTEELDLPEGSEVLLATFLRMKAEQDMEIGSRDALAAKQEWESALARYSSDQAKADDQTAPVAFNFTMSRPGRRF